MPGTPARGYRWPDATPGNTIAMQSGYRSERRIVPLAAAILEQAREGRVVAVMAGRRELPSGPHRLVACRSHLRVALALHR